MPLRRNPNRRIRRHPNGTKVFWFFFKKRTFFAYAARNSAAKLPTSAVSAVDCRASSPAAVSTSLAVAPDVEGRGHGAKLVEAVAAEATRFGVRNLFALTRIPGWFSRNGFETVDRAVLYHKVWGDCASCPKRDACDEVAVVRPLVPGASDRLRDPDPILAARVAHVVPPRTPGMSERPVLPVFVHEEVRRPLTAVSARRRRPHCDVAGDARPG